MSEPSQARGVLRFQLFGVPVTIMPIAWVMLVILGGGLGVSDKSGLLQVLLFTAAGMLVLLVHEFGHALVGRWLGGGQPLITIAGMGGVTYTPVLPPTRGRYLAMVAAGPLASLLPGLLAGLALGCCVGQPLAGLCFAWLVPLPVTVPGSEWAVFAMYQGLKAHALPQEAVLAAALLMQVSFWWSVFNLLPIFPLDGGKLLGTLLHNDRMACFVGLLISAALAVWSLVSQNWFNVMITGYLAYINYRILRELRGRA